MNGDKITCTVGSTSSAYNTAANLAFLVNYGAVDMTLTLRDSGDVAAASGIVLTVVLIVLAAMLVFALLYLLCTGKLTGLSAFLGVLCAVVLNLFFVASIIVPTEYMLNVGWPWP